MLLPVPHAEPTELMAATTRFLAAGHAAMRNKEGASRKEGREMGSDN